LNCNVTCEEKQLLSANVWKKAYVQQLAFNLYTNTFCVLEN